MSTPIPKNPSRISAVLAVIVMGFGVYWSLRSRSGIPFATLLPHWLVMFTARHGVLQNIPAYFIVSLLWFIAGRSWQQRMVFGIALAIFGGLVEVVQIWMPHRYPSVLDAVCSWAGIALAWWLCRLGRALLWRWRSGSIHQTEVTEVDAKEEAAEMVEG